jgi:putative membrane protein
MDRGEALSRSTADRLTPNAPLISAGLSPGRADADSRARTHLANERTFLAWLRSGLSLVAVGMAAARFLPLDLVPGVPYVTLFSILLVIAGTVMVIFGAVRYVAANREIEAGALAPAITPIVVTALVVAVLGMMALPLVFLLR